MYIHSLHSPHHLLTPIHPRLPHILVTLFSNCLQESGHFTIKNQQHQSPAYRPVHIPFIHHSPIISYPAGGGRPPPSSFSSSKLPSFSSSTLPEQSTILLVCYLHTTAFLLYTLLFFQMIRPDTTTNKIIETISNNFKIVYLCENVCNTLRTVFEGNLISCPC